MRPSLSIALELSAAVGLWLIAPGHASLLPSSSARPDARPVAPLRDATAELTGPLGETYGQYPGWALRGGGVTPEKSMSSSDSHELNPVSGESDRGGGGGGGDSAMADAHESEGTGDRGSQGGATALCESGAETLGAEALVNLADELQAGGRVEEVAQAMEYYGQVLLSLKDWFGPASLARLGSFSSEMRRV
jgi:hypothetical protein